MAKKKLILNESTTRKFMKYANIKPTYVTNFLSEAEHAKKEEEDEKMEEGYGMGNREDEEEKEELKEQEDEMGMEPDMDMEIEDEMDMKPEGDDAEDLLMDLLAHVQKFAEEKGVTMELDGDEDMDDEGMEDMDAAPEGGDMGMADDDVDADLEAAGAEAVDDEAVIAEVTRRVARRLLRESAKRK